MALSYNQELHNELLLMVKKDQDIRFCLLQSNELDQKLIEEIIKVDSKHVARMKEIISQYGWPGINLVGEDGDHAAWLLVQHADHDVSFQLLCLDLIMIELDKGNSIRQNIAYLTDRVLVNQGMKQRYGTQYSIKNDNLILEPLEDVEQVDELRAKMNLCPLQEYVAFAQEQYQKHRESKN